MGFSKHEFACIPLAAVHSNISIMLSYSKYTQKKEKCTKRKEKKKTINYY